jgi:hypothetical protein
VIFFVVDGESTDDWSGCSGTMAFDIFFASDPRYNFQLAVAYDRAEEDEKVLAAFLTARQNLMHVTIVDKELPYPPNLGKRIRTLNLLLPFTRLYRITYLAYSHPNSVETRQAVEFFRSQDIETVLLDRRLPSKSGPVFYGRMLWKPIGQSGDPT